MGQSLGWIRRPLGPGTKGQQPLGPWAQGTTAPWALGPGDNSPLGPGPLALWARPLGPGPIHEPMRIVLDSWFYELGQTPEPDLDQTQIQVQGKVNELAPEP